MLLSPVVAWSVVAEAAQVVEAVVPRRPPLEHSRYGSVASETQIISTAKVYSAIHLLPQYFVMFFLVSCMGLLGQ